MIYPRDVEFFQVRVGCVFREETKVNCKPLSVVADPLPAG